jgi:hypothetical protein
MAFLNWLEATSYSEWILVSAVGWPLMLSIHAFGLAITVGVIFTLNMRLLGLYGTIPYASMRDLMSIAWIGISLNVFTGLSIFIAQASTYVTSIPFIIKITLIVLGCVTLVRTQKILKLEGMTWDASGVVSRTGQKLAIASLLFWIVAVVTGRLIAYI